MGSADHSVTNTVSRRLPRAESWLDDAPCRGMWWLTDIPPDLTRHHARASVVAAMRPALELCADCPFTRQCLERVAPRESYYDGVCGGICWRNGEAIGGLTGVIAGRAA